MHNICRNGCKSSASARDTKENGRHGEMMKVRKKRRRKKKKNRVSNIFLPRTNLDWGDC